MGTRGLTVVRKGGENKIAQYGQWDHYPSGQGLNILQFISQKDNLKNLEDHLVHCKFVESEYVDKLIDAYTDRTDGFMTIEQSEKFSKDHPELSRDTGGNILNLIADSTREIGLVDSSNFANDPLFCEGIYRIDFDTREFWAQYHDKIKIFDLDNLPTFDEFLDAFDGE